MRFKDMRTVPPLRGGFALVVMIVTLGACTPVYGADTGERIAILVSSAGLPFEEALSGFRGYLAKRGIEADYDVYRLPGDGPMAEQAVQKIKKNGARLIFTLGSAGAEAASRIAPDIPVVACLVLRSDNLARAPNATGVGLEFPMQTQFRWLQTILPKAKTIGVIYNPDENKKRVEDAARIAHRLGLRLEAFEVQTPRDVPSALTALSKRADVLWGLADTLTLSPELAKYMLLFAFRNSIPFIGPSDAWVRAGALYSLEWDYQDLGVQCGEMALRILQGTPASAIPPATPRKVLYTVNLKTAQQMKIAIPEQITKRARTTY